jgi:hypothetical protein
MVFSYNSNFHVHIIGQKSITEKPVNIPTGPIKFFISNPIKGVIVDVEGKIHCEPNIPPGDYLITIKAFINNKMVDSTNIILFSRYKEDDSLYNDNSYTDHESELLIHKNVNKKVNKKVNENVNKKVNENVNKKVNENVNKKVNIGKQVNKKTPQRKYGFDNMANNFKDYNAKTYGITIVVFSLLIALINSMT